MAVCHIYVFAFLLALSSVVEAYTTWRLRKLLPAVVACCFVFVAYKVFKRDDKARRTVVGFSRFSAIGVALAGLYMCSWSKIPGVNAFGLTFNPTTVGQLFALMAAGVLVCLIPGSVSYTHLTLPTKA